MTTNKILAEDAVSCWMVSEKERLDSLKNKLPFANHLPYCYFKITERIDNKFIAGNLGHVNIAPDFHGRIHNTTYTYLQTFEKRNPVYLSFDNVTLYKLIEVIQGNPSTFILKRIDNPKYVVSNKAFMIMPFKFQEINEFYFSSIRDFLFSEMQIQIYRADDFNGNDIIIETIYNQIEESEFIIADISHPNKNVFYELGWASAIEKEIITIQNRKIEDNVFFDRAHIRSVFYSFDEVDKFQQELKNTIIAIRDKVLAKN